MSKGRDGYHWKPSAKDNVLQVGTARLVTVKRKNGDIVVKVLAPESVPISKPEQAPLANLVARVKA